MNAPCPFCGCLDILLGDSEPLPQGNYVTCARCLADGPLADTQPGAIAAWNVRTTPEI